MAKLKISNRFGIIPNNLLNNKDISFKAKGLFGYLQSKPDERDFSADRIQRDSKESRDAVLTGLKELEKAGYLIRNKFKNSLGQWDVEYILFDEPTTENPTRVENLTESENPTLENPLTENPTYNKKESIKKEIVKKKKNDICLFSDFWVIYKRKIDKTKAQKKFETLSSDDQKNALAGAKKWAEKWEAEKTDIQYIPHPTTWLNNRRWEADIFINNKKNNIPKNALTENKTSYLDGFEN